MPDILFEDKYILAVLKKPGELSQSDGEDIAAALPYNAHIINRLDRPVGGIVLLAKDKKTAAQLTALMHSGGITKRYLAVVCGKCADSEQLTDYLITDKRLNISKPVNKGNTGAKEARLAYRLIAEKNELSLIDVTLFTGRHHQIRMQLAHRGIPIWGDTKYNPTFKHKRGVVPALFAHSLQFIHPVTKDEVTIKAVPDYSKFEEFENEIQSSDI